MTDAFTLRPDVQEALREYNRHTTQLLCAKIARRSVHSPRITDPEVIARLQQLALPGEDDLNDTILRLLRGGASFTIT